MGCYYLHKKDREYYCARCLRHFGEADVRAKNNHDQK